MSDHDEVIHRLNVIEANTQWMIDSLKYLLQQQAGYQLEAPVEEYADDPPPEPVVEEAPAPVQAVCGHPQQVKVGADIRCAKCGHVLISGSGLGGPASALREAE